MAYVEPLKTGTRFRPSKKLGQHFLVDRNIIDKIITIADFDASDSVLEIGPGTGALTLPLSQSVDHIIAVEKDAFLTELLEEKLSREGITNVTLINHDILRLDLHEATPPSSKKIQVIGNLPYNISTPFLEKLIKNRGLLAKAVLMFQLEVAERLTALPGGKAYGAMTLLVRYHALANPLLKVKKESFYPRPKVDSMVLDLDFKHPYTTGEVQEEIFKKVVRGAFSHRRKMLFNSLKGFSSVWDTKKLLMVMEKCGIDPKRRAETLDMDEFLCLTSGLSSEIDKKNGQC